MTPTKTTVWPAIIKSLEWLKRQGVIDPAKVGGLFTAAQISAAAAGALVDRKMLADLNRELQASAAAGEGRFEWQQRVRKVVTTRAFFEENLHRTLTHQAYHRGIEDVASHPAITDEFPYRLYAATNDARTRPAHAAMDGKVAHRGSPLAKEMQRLADEYNCRCTIILLSREDAVTRGIDDNAGWTEPEKEKPKAKPVTKPKAPTQPKPIDPPKATESEIQAKIRELQRLIDQIDPEQERQELAKKGTIAEKLAAFKAGDAMLEKMRAAAKEMPAQPELMTWQEVDAQITKDTGIKNPDFGNVPDYVKRLDAIREKNWHDVDAIRAERRAALASQPAPKIKIRKTPQGYGAFDFSRLDAVASDSATVDIRWEKPIPGIKERIENVGTWLKSITKTHVVVDIIEHDDPIDGRAHALVGQLGIVVTQKGHSSTETAIVHEIGHLFEANEGVRKAAEEFRDARMGRRGRDVPKEQLEDIGAAAGSEPGIELTLGELPTGSSYFSTPHRRKYTAKVYTDGVTEVVAMGIQAMYDDPILFAQEDPEYFKFVYGVLRGAFTEGRYGKMK